MIQSKIYEHDANVEADVHKCLDILTTGLKCDINKWYYPTTYITKKPKDCPHYDPRLKMVFLTPKSISDGWTLAEEAAHALRVILESKDAPCYVKEELWHVEEFYGRLGARLVQNQCYEHYELDKLFEGRRPSSPQKIADKEMAVINKGKKLEERLQKYKQAYDNGAISRDTLKRINLRLARKLQCCMREKKNLEAHRLGYAAADKVDLNDILENHNDIFGWNAEKATKFVDGLLAA